MEQKNRPDAEKLEDVQLDQVTGGTDQTGIDSLDLNSGSMRGSIKHVIPTPTNDITEDEQEKI